MTSGKDTKRPKLQAALEYLRDGDTLFVHSMDRLARNTEDLLRMVRELNERGVAVTGEPHLQRQARSHG
jgi:DNA invertase Pin-like site-specific DNA recombinase